MIQKTWTAAWHSAGLAPGDVALIHSSIGRTLKSALSVDRTEPTPAALLASFLDAVSPGGTLLFPLFNFDFTRGVPFDFPTTPSQMGALTEAARLHPEAVRTGHPIYSFAAIGERAAAFRGIENFSGYGADSPFGLLRELDGKIAVLDLEDQNSVTFYHHVEEMEQVDYRYHKTFTAPYTGADGVTAERSFGLFVRDLERGVMTSVNPMGERLWAQGRYQGFRPKDGPGLRTIRARVLFDETAKVIRDGQARGLLYEVESPR